MSDDTAIANTEQPKPPMLVGSQGLELNSLDSIWRFAGILSKSGLAPKGLESQEALTIAIQMGLEVGLAPMQAVQNIAVINGRPCLWGDGALAVVMASGHVEYIKEWFTGNFPNDDFTAHIELKRKNNPHPIKQSFSIGDAKKAELWGKGAVWPKYPKRMLQMRPRGYALRDGFADALKGFRMAEEAQDNAIDVTSSATTIEVVDEPKAKKKAVAPADFGQDQSAPAPTTPNDQADDLPFEV